MLSFHGFPVFRFSCLRLDHPYDTLSNQTLQKLRRVENVSSYLESYDKKLAVIWFVRDERGYEVHTLFRI